MEKKENKIEKVLVNGKFKNNFWLTKKTTYSLLALIVCLVLIVILSCVNAGFNPNILKAPEFWINYSISAGLCIFGMITGNQMGEDIAKNNPNGQFRKCLARYSAIYQKIENACLFSFFDDWLNTYKEKKLKKKIEEYLRDNGIHQLEVLNLDLQEINNLKQPYHKIWSDGKETYFLSCDEEQIEAIKKCLKGKIKIGDLSKSFFVDALINETYDIWESASKSDKKKTTYLGLNYSFRIVFLLAISFLMNGLTRGEVITIGGIALQLWSRIYTLTMAVIFGIYIGFKLVNMDNQYINFKIDILNQFYEENELGIYKHKSLEEIAKEEFENQENFMLLDHYSKEEIENGNETTQETDILD